jgi:hypothetical protein
MMMNVRWRGTRSRGANVRWRSPSSRGEQMDIEGNQQMDMDNDDGEHET